MIKSIDDYRAYLEADRRASSWGGDKTFEDRVRTLIFTNPIEEFQVLLRKVELHRNRWHRGDRLFYLYYSVRLKSLSLKLGFSIPPNVFGPGLSIPHYGTIVVNGRSRVGANCRLHAGVNIGASGGAPDAPVLGDNVYLGPGAIVFGRVSIADNVTVGANATVNRSIEVANCTVAGTPARIVKENTSVWWQKNALDLSGVGCPP